MVDTITIRNVNTGEVRVVPRIQTTPVPKLQKEQVQKFTTTVPTTTLSKREEFVKSQIEKKAQSIKDPGERQLYYEAMRRVQQVPDFGA